MSVILISKPDGHRSPSNFRRMSDLRNLFFLNYEKWVSFSVSDFSSHIFCRLHLIVSKVMLLPRIFTIRFSSVLVFELFLFGTVYYSPTEAQALCYNDDGKVALGDSACNPHLKHSMCCRGYWTCLDNGICSAENTTELNTLPFSFARATCTDPNWESPACPRFCLNGIHNVLVLIIWVLLPG